MREVSLKESRKISLYFMNFMNRFYFLEPLLFPRNSSSESDEHSVFDSRSLFISKSQRSFYGIINYGSALRSRGGSVSKDQVIKSREYFYNNE